jgi:hypothetical protein
MFLSTSVRHIYHEFDISCECANFRFEDLLEAHGKGIPIDVVQRVIILCLTSAKIFEHVLYRPGILEEVTIVIRDHEGVNV